MIIAVRTNAVSRGNWALLMRESCGRTGERGERGVFARKGSDGVLQSGVGAD